MGHVVVVESPPGTLPYEDVVRRYAGYVLGVARAVLRETDLAEDACQEAFLALLHRQEAFEAEAALRVWLGRVARNAALKSIRSRARRRRREHAVGAAAMREAGSMDVTASDPGRALKALVDELPDEHRLVVRLKYFQRVPQHEIAALLDCSTGTVSNRLRDALVRLRRLVTRAGVVGLAPDLEAGLGGLAPDPVPSALVDRLLHLEGLVTAATVSGGVSVLVKILIPVIVLLAGAVGAVVWIPSLSRSDATEAGGGRVLANAPSPGEDAPRLAGRAAGVPAADPADMSVNAGAAPVAAPAHTIVLKGRVLDPDGAPAVGATVRVETPTKASTRVRRETTTREDGTWIVEDLPSPERYEIAIRHEGAAPLLDRLGLLDGASTPALALEHRLHAGWSIRGLLLDPRGEPIVGPVPIVIHAGRSTGGSTLTVDETGAFAIQDLDPRKHEPASFRLEIRHPRFRPFVLGEWLDRIGRDGWAVVEIRLEAGASISGVVRAPDGAAPAGTELLLLPEGVDPDGFAWNRRTAKPDTQGRYAFEGLPEGRYVLRGHAPRLVLERPLTIEVQGTDTVVRDVTLAPGRTIVGRVVDAKGRGLTRVRVSVNDGIQPFWLGLDEPVDAEGRFRIEGLSFERQTYGLFLTYLPSFEPGDLTTTVVRSSPREVEILVRSKTVLADPGEGAEAGHVSEGPAQVKIPCGSVSVTFPAGD